MFYNKLISTVIFFYVRPLCTCLMLYVRNIFLVLYSPKHWSKFYILEGHLQPKSELVFWTRHLCNYKTRIRVRVIFDKDNVLSLIIENKYVRWPFIFTLIANWMQTQIIIIIWDSLFIKLKLSINNRVVKIVLV